MREGIETEPSQGPHPREARKDHTKRKTNEQAQNKRRKKPIQPSIHPYAHNTHLSSTFVSLAKLILLASIHG